MDDHHSQMTPGVPGYWSTFRGWAVATWNRWAQLANQGRQLGESPIPTADNLRLITPKEFNIYLKDFVSNMRRSNGAKFNGQSSGRICQGLAAHLVNNLNCPHLNFLDKDNDNFVKFQNMPYKRKQHLRNRCTSKQMKDLIDKLDREKKPRDKRFLDMDCPKSLVRAVYAFNYSVFGIDTIEAHDMLLASQFVVGSDEDGDFVAFYGNLQEYEQLSAENLPRISVEEIKLYDTGEKDSVYNIFKKYLSCIPHSGKFYILPGIVNCEGGTKRKMCGFSTTPMNYSQIHKIHKYLITFQNRRKLLLLNDTDAQRRRFDMNIHPSQIVNPVNTSSTSVNPKTNVFSQAYHIIPIVQGMGNCAEDLLYGNENKVVVILETDDVMQETASQKSSSQGEVQQELWAEVSNHDPVSFSSLGKELNLLQSSQNMMPSTQNMMIDTSYLMTGTPNQMMGSTNLMTDTQNLMTSPPNQMTSPPNQMTSPRNQMTSPPTMMIGTQNLMTCPTNQITSPPNLMIGTQNLMTSPPNQMTSPPNLMTSPPTLMIGTQNLMTSPSNQMTSPSNQMTSPPNLMTSPPTLMIGTQNLMTSPPNLMTSPPTLMIGTLNLMTSPPNLITSPPNLITSPPNLLTGTQNLMTCNTKVGTGTSNHHCIPVLRPLNIYISPETTQVENVMPHDRKTLLPGPNVDQSKDVSSADSRLSLTAYQAEQIISGCADETSTNQHETAITSERHSDISNVLSGRNQSTTEHMYPNTNDIPPMYTGMTHLGSQTLQCHSRGAEESRLNVPSSIVENTGSYETFQTAPLQMQMNLPPSTAHPMKTAEYQHTSPSYQMDNASSERPIQRLRSNPGGVHQSPPEPYPYQRVRPITTSSPSQSQDKLSRTNLTNQYPPLNGETQPVSPVEVSPLSGMKAISEYPNRQEMCGKSSSSSLLKQLMPMQPEVITQSAPKNQEQQRSRKKHFSEHDSQEISLKEKLLKKIISSKCSLERQSNKTGCNMENQATPENKQDDNQKGATFSAQPITEPIQTLQGTPASKFIPVARMTDQVSSPSNEIQTHQDYQGNPQDLLNNKNGNGFHSNARGENTEVGKDKVKMTHTGSHLEEKIRQHKIEANSLEYETEIILIERDEDEIPRDVHVSPSTIDTGIQDTPLKQTNQSARDSQPDRQTNQSARDSRPDRQTNQSARDSRPDRQTNQSARDSRPDRQTNQSARDSRPDRQSLDQDITELLDFDPSLRKSFHKKCTDWWNRHKNNFKMDTLLKFKSSANGRHVSNKNNENFLENQQEISLKSDQLLKGSATTGEITKSEKRHAPLSLSGAEAKSSANGRHVSNKNNANFLENQQEISLKSDQLLKGSATTGEITKSGKRHAPLSLSGADACSDSVQTSPNSGEPKYKCLKLNVNSASVYDNDLPEQYSAVCLKTKSWNGVGVQCKADDVKCMSAFYVD